MKPIKATDPTVLLTASHPSIPGLSPEDLERLELYFEVEADLWAFADRLKIGFAQASIWLVQPAIRAAMDCVDTAIRIGQARTARAIAEKALSQALDLFGVITEVKQQLQVIGLVARLSQYLSPRAAPARARKAPPQPIECHCPDCSQSALSTERGRRTDDAISPQPATEPAADRNVLSNPSPESPNGQLAPACICDHERGSLATPQDSKLGQPQLPVHSPVQLQPESPAQSPAQSQNHRSLQSAAA